MSERSVQADVVKKANLRFKASKLRGTTGTSVQGPKTYKDFYIVFRAVSGERKELEMYSNERRFAEAGPPKSIVELKDVMGVHVINGKRNEFYIELSDGGMCLFETRSPEESMDWVSCLNAVLFAKGPNGEGVLQYDVELQETAHLSYRGLAILELRDGELIVKRRDSHSEVVRWRLSHIRSFKAKKRLLTIFSGSRSSTGVGEFLFKSDRSVEITHAIETVVGAMAKDKKSSSRGAKAGHSPLPHSHVLNDGAVIRNWSSSIIDSIPEFQPPVVYEDIPDGGNLPNGLPGYGKLNFHSSSNMVGASSPPHITSPEHEGGPRRGVRHTSPTPRPVNHHGRAPPVPLPTRKVGGRRDYEDLDLDGDEEEMPSNGTRRIESDNYSRLEREKSPVGKISTKGPPLPSRPHVPPPTPKPGDQPVQVPDGLYASINKPKKRMAVTVHGSRPLPPTMAPKPPPSSLSGSNPDLSGIGLEEYGKLDRRPAPQQLYEEEYNTLDHVTTKLNGTSPEREEYGKLDRTGRSKVVGSGAGGVPHIAEQYGKLELTQTNMAAIPSSSHYEMMDDLSPTLSSSGVPAATPLHETYGKLQHTSTSSNSAAANTTAAATPRVTKQRGEEYGRLERPTATKTSVPSTPEDEYGHLETRPRTSSFNPYGTLAPEGHEEGEAVRDRKDSKTAPPPGYENAEFKEPSLAYRMSVTSSQLMSRPQAPPRAQSTSPNLSKRAHSGYVNVDDKGKVRKVSPPLPRPKPSQLDPKSENFPNSHDTSLKSHDMNGGTTAYYSACKLKPTVTSSDYEDTEKLDFGPRPKPMSSLHTQTSSSTNSVPSMAPPPPAPRKGVSNRNATSSANSIDLVDKPSVARKPPVLKLKPTNIH